MAVHIVKLCVGADTVEDLSRWQESRRALSKTQDGVSRLVHKTGQMPRRRDEILAGGSIYWVVKRLIQVRQRIIGLEEGIKENGKPCCMIVLDPQLVPVRPKRRRPFQGWRYLEMADAPTDAGGSQDEQLMDMPISMRRELAELCLI